VYRRTQGTFLAKREPLAPESLRAARYLGVATQEHTGRNLQGLAGGKFIYSYHWSRYTREHNLSGCDNQLDPNNTQIIKGIHPLVWLVTPSWTVAKYHYFKPVSWEALPANVIAAIEATNVFGVASLEGSFAEIRDSSHNLTDELTRLRSLEQKVSVKAAVAECEHGLYHNARVEKVLLDYQASLK